MKLEPTAGGVLALAGLGVLVVLWLKRDAIGQAAKDAAQAVNPASRENLAYRGVNAAGGALTGSADWTLGGAIYDATHDPVKPGDPTAGDKGVLETFADKYVSWAGGFWGGGASSSKPGATAGNPLVVDLFAPEPAATYGRAGPEPLFSYGLPTDPNLPPQ